MYIGWGAEIAEARQCGHAGDSGFAMLILISYWVPSSLYSHACEYVAVQPWIYIWTRSLQILISDVKRKKNLEKQQNTEKVKPKI